MSSTTNALDALLAIRNGNTSGAWNTTANLGDAVTLSYSFLTTQPTYDTGHSNFAPLTAAQQGAVQQALQLYAEVCDVTFQQGTSGKTQITFGQDAQATNQLGYAYYPSSAASSPSVYGDVWLADSWSWRSGDWNPTGEGFVTVLHELGHAMGLKHSFQESAGDYYLPADMDHEGYTVMAYDSAPHTGIVSDLVDNGSTYNYNITNVHPSTLMMDDIEALQYLYGANTSTRAGKSTYSWGTSEKLLETIWDGGGSDTINCSNQVLDCVINLNAGSFSSIGLRLTDAQIRADQNLPSWFSIDAADDLYNGRNNLGIARGVTIENATGGKADDQILGNDANNRLLGGSGNDSLTGGVGRDALYGGAGSDTLTGGAGADTLLGGVGRDQLTGGTGADVFKFQVVRESGVGATLRDVVHDFEVGVDKIDLSKIDANTALVGNQAFGSLTVGSSFSGSFSAAGQLYFDTGSHVLWGNVDADAQADFGITLAGLGNLHMTDLVA